MTHSQYNILPLCKSRYFLHVCVMQNYIHSGMTLHSITHNSQYKNMVTDVFMYKEQKRHITFTSIDFFLTRHKACSPCLFINDRRYWARSWCILAVVWVLITWPSRGVCSSWVGPRTPSLWGRHVPTLWMKTIWRRKQQIQAFGSSIMTTSAYCSTACTNSKFQFQLLFSQ